MDQLELIYSALISCMPALASIIGVVAACIVNIKKSRRAADKVMQQTHDLQNAVNEKTDVTEVKVAIKQCLQENAELKRQLRKVVSKLDHIDEKDVEV